MGIDARAIREGLARACKESGSMDVTAGRDRLIIFSDLHKGARDGADDFQRCEPSYNAALAYYLELGWHLIELGDVEDLWENTFHEVAASYPQTLELAAKFHRAGRYTRLWGNHDLAWKSERLFARRMAKYGYGGVSPIEALRLQVHDPAGRRLGELFLVHGHQGSADSDRFAWLAYLAVHFGWRRVQRWLNRPWNTPSVDWDLRGQHADAMKTWAASERRVLIAGHTHQPVFYAARKQAVPAPASAPDRALELAWKEWAEADKRRLDHQKPYVLESPCYFNTGCCAFGDGDITGIEIADGQIRLVRWPCSAQSQRQVLGDPLELAEVFRLACG